MTFRSMELMAGGGCPGETPRRNQTDAECAAPHASYVSRQLPNRGTISYSLTTRFVVFLLVVLGGLFLPDRDARVWGQNSPPPKQVTQAIDKEQIGAVREQVAAATDLEEETRRELQAQCDEAIRFLEAAAASQSHMAELQASIDSAEQDMAAAEENLESLQAKAVGKPDEAASLDALRDELLKKEKQLESAKNRLSDLEAELIRRVAGQRELPEKIGNLEQELQKIDQQLSTLGAEETNSPAARVEWMLLLAKRRATQATIDEVEKELEAYAATRELLPLQQRLAAEQITKAQAEVEHWRRVVNLRMGQEAEQQTAKARQEVSQTIPALQPLAEKNQELAEATEEATASLIAESKRLKSITETLEQVSSGLDRMRERGKGQTGFSEAMGLLLRTRRASLPDVDPHRRAIQLRQSQLRDIQVTLFELEERRAKMANFDAHLQRKVAEVRPNAEGLSLRVLEAAVREMLAKQREQLDAAINQNSDLLGLLVEMDEQQGDLIETVEAYRDYINERVFWIRSDQPVELDDLSQAAKTLQKAFSAERPLAWPEMAGLFKADIKRQPIPWVLATIILILWMHEQRRFRRWLNSWGEAAEQSHLSRIAPTFFALLLTLALAGFWPLVLKFLVWRLRVPVETTASADGLAAGLTVAAWWLFPGLLLRKLSRPKGLGEAHFNWAPGALRALRRHLGWLMPAVLPLAFIVAALEGTGVQQWSGSAGRISLILACLLIGVFAQVVLRPGGEFFRQLRAARYEGVFYRFRHLWWALFMVVVALLIVLALLGYNYTAQQLSQRIGYTVLFPLVLLVLHGFLTRWILVARRQLAMEQLRQRRGAQEKTRGSPEGTGLVFGSGIGEERADLSASSAQSQRLLRSFLWLFAAVAVYFIWIDMLPALTVLDRIPAIPGSVEVVEQTTGDDAADAIAVVPRISVGDLGLAVLALLMTIIAARNVPGLLDISIPKRFPLDAGARYAITTLSRYVIVAAGIVVGANFLGIGWSKIQWLVAAVSVGLGFGLQEIFANFVSGLIILFERPIRIGDIVTVEGTTGFVTRIQTRATTVTNWDRQEFIVPNKEFITGRLLNWTRSDKLNRAVISVGVAYGSDTALVTELLKKVAQAHPNVLSEPEPLITFDEFGDSSLNFTVRVYLPDFEKRLITIHELNQGIDQAFRDAGVEIPFPQRDVHFRGGSPDSQEIPRPSPAGEEER